MRGCKHVRDVTDEAGGLTCERGQGPAEGCYWPAELRGVCGRSWTSSEKVPRPGEKVAVGFYTPEEDAVGPGVSLSVRCVRGKPAP